jgi:hypothetical protein
MMFEIGAGYNGWLGASPDGLIDPGSSVHGAEACMARATALAAAAAVASAAAPACMMAPAGAADEALTAGGTASAAPAAAEAAAVAAAVGLLSAQAAAAAAAAANQAAATNFAPFVPRFDPRAAAMIGEGRGVLEIKVCHALCRSFAVCVCCQLPGQSRLACH